MMRPTLAGHTRFGLACAAALLLFTAAYSNSLRNAFAFDDLHVIQTNAFIRDLANVPRFFTDAGTFSNLPQNAVYRPLVTLTLAFDHWRAGGPDPLQFHVTQLVLFAALGALLTLFYRRVFDTADTVSWHRWAALFAAALYCVHTGNSQVGNYISARSELLAALGVVGSFVLYIDVPASRRLQLYLLPAALGLLAKNHAVLFAPLLLAYKVLIEQQLSLRDVLLRRSCPGRRRVLVSTIPAFVVLGAGVAFVESMSAAGQHYGGGGRLPYLVTSAWVWVRYLGLYFLPTGLSADTDLRLFSGPPPIDPRTVVGVAVLIATLVWAWRASRERSTRPIAFGILWFWIGIAPTSTVIPLAEVTNDHRMFLGFVGLNLAIVWAIARRLPLQPSIDPARDRRVARWVGGAALVVLGLHAASTYQRNKVWRDDETLWADVARKSPRNGRGLMNYGLAHMKRGRLLEARELFQRAQVYNPNYTYLEANLGIVNNALGDSVAAERHFRRALALEPNQPVAHRHYARWLVEHGRGPEGLAHLHRLVGLAPGDAEGRHSLMGLYAATGSETELRSLAGETVRLMGSDRVAQIYAGGGVPFTPGTPDGQGWYLLGWSFTQAGRHVDAAQAYRAAVAADSRHAEAWNNLGWTLGKMGFYDLAVPALDKAIALRPGFALARRNLAWVRAEQPNRSSGGR